MRHFHNINRSGFHRGEYVGYAGGAVWRIKRADGWWRASVLTPSADVPASSGKSAPTLADLSAFLSSVDADMREKHSPQHASARTGAPALTAPTEAAIETRVARAKNGSTNTRRWLPDMPETLGDVTSSPGALGRAWSDARTAAVQEGPGGATITLRWADGEWLRAVTDTEAEAIYHLTRLGFKIART